jgi:hypothetical protein
VTRDVYAADGSLLDHDVFYSSYRAEPKLVRIGPKKQKSKNGKKPKSSTTTPAQTTPAPPTQTAPTETAPTQTTTQPQPD